MHRIEASQKGSSTREPAASWTHKQQSRSELAALCFCVLHLWLFACLSDVLLVHSLLIEKTQIGGLVGKDARENLRTTTAGARAGTHSERTMSVEREEEQREHACHRVQTASCMDAAARNRSDLNSPVDTPPSRLSSIVRALTSASARMSSRL